MGWSRATQMSDLAGLVGLFFAGMVAGAINSVAGGGTLVSFPSLVAFGEPEIVSNATNTAAMWPGSFSSALGYRKDTSVQRGLLVMLAIPSLVGGLLGAVILVITPAETFKHVVPFLVLFATLLLASRDIIARKLGNNPADEEHVTTLGRIWGGPIPIIRRHIRRLLRSRHRHPNVGIFQRHGSARHTQDECDQDSSCYYHQRDCVLLLRAQRLGSLAFSDSHGRRCDYWRLWWRALSQTCEP